MGHITVVFDLVGQPQAVALPFAGLAHQMRPGNRSVVRRIKTDPGQPLCDRFIGVGQQAAAVRNAGQEPEIGLGNAKGQIGPMGVPPRLPNLTLAQDHSRNTRPGMNRSQELVPGGRVSLMDAPSCGIFERIARPVDLVSSRIGDGLFDQIHVLERDPMA